MSRTGNTDKQLLWAGLIWAVVALGVFDNVGAGVGGFIVTALVIGLADEDGVRTKWLLSAGALGVISVLALTAQRSFSWFVEGSCPAPLKSIEAYSGKGSWVVNLLDNNPQLSVADAHDFWALCQEHNSGMWQMGGGAGALALVSAVVALRRPKTQV